MEAIDLDIRDQLQQTMVGHTSTIVFGGLSVISAAVAYTVLQNRGVGFLLCLVSLLSTIQRVSSARPHSQADIGEKCQTIVSVGLVWTMITSTTNVMCVLSGQTFLVVLASCVCTGLAFGAAVNNEEVRARLLEFVQHATLTISQISSCNGLHQAPGRVARWILMAQDRTQVPVLEFTQEFLAEMLGLRRTTITNVAQALQEADLITYSRGRLRIVDREGLEAASCSCYPMAQRLLRDLYRLPFSARSPRFPIQGESESFVARTSSGN